MAALPDQGYGVDPASGQPAPMPQTDPNSPPADPNLDPYTADPNVAVPSSRDRVELCLLLAIERCAKGVEIGDAASNPEWAQKYGQAAQSLALAFQAIQGKQAPSQPFGG